MSTAEDARRDYDQLIRTAGLLNAAEPDYWAEIVRLAREELSRPRNAPDSMIGPERVTSRQEAERREHAWIAAGRPGHEFSKTGERWCRACGCEYDGIQHRPDYPREGLPA
jgi:hypothetical protein